MSDFLPQDILTELWEEILKLHWIYLDTEESIEKLENRKKLEDRLREFLSIAQHDHKFFVPEVGQVLKNSIQLETFSVQKAITAFEAISQYANNLFAKPWRKEFRILKMYSGFYKHEIKANLVDAEILFEAMGYRRLSEGILILDGPICPDQVTNVARDAMTAYVELQIIKHIYTGLDAIGVKCSWLDIYRYREKNTGGTSQAVKAIIYAFEDKRFRSRQKTGDNYDYIEIQPPSNYFETSSQFCPASCQCAMFQQVHSVPRRPQISRSNGIYCEPADHQQSSNNINYLYSNMRQLHYPHTHRHALVSTDNGGVLQSQMSHSRSLEHYSEPGNYHTTMLPHRHSFDHQQQGCTTRLHSQQQLQQRQNYQYLNQPQNIYELPYNCIDGNSLGGGSSNISYAAVAGATAAYDSGGVGINSNLNSNSTYSNPYNVSGNRFPLPLNISNQLSAYDNLQLANFNVAQEPTYARVNNQQMYSSDSKLTQNLIKNIPASSYNQLHNHYGIQNSLLVEDSVQEQRPCQTQQLINFEDPAMVPSTTQQQLDASNQYSKNLATSSMRNATENSLPPVAMTYQQHCAPDETFTTNDVHVYAKPTPKENRNPNASNFRKNTYNCRERGDTTDVSYESANDDFVKQTNETDRNQPGSPTQFQKNQDGVGSVESWNNVFQNLEKDNNTKDLGERSDLLVQSLDLDSLNINNDISPSQSNATEKRTPYYCGSENKSVTHLQQKQHQELESNQKSKTFANSRNLSKNKAKLETSAYAPSCSDTIQNHKTSRDNNAKKVKSALKQTSKSNTNPDKTQPKTNDNKTLHKTMNNNNIDFSTNSGGETIQRKEFSSVDVRRRSPPVVSTNAPPLSTPVTGLNEWNCRYCTFLNPQYERICSMCFRSKDFNLDSSTNTTATGGTAAHNTPACA